jgi:hypothetical protein
MEFDHDQPIAIRHVTFYTSAVGCHRNLPMEAEPLS